MDDFERRLRRSLTTIRDESSDSYERPTWEARAEVLQRIRRRRSLYFVAAGAVGATALAAIVYIAARPPERSPDLPPSGEQDLLAPIGVIPVGDGPRDLSVGGRGRIWSANSDETITRIEGDVTETFPLPGLPDDIAIARGPVWVALPEQGAIVEVDPLSGPLEPLQVSEPAEAMELTAGLDTLWVVSRGEQLTAVDVADRTSAAVDLDLAPVDVAVHGDSAWVVGVDGRVIPVDQETRTALDQSFTVPPSSEGDLTYAAGSLWYLTGLDGDVTRLDPASGELTTTSFDGVVVDLAIDPEVAWLVLRRDDGTSWLQRVDRTNGRAQGDATPIAGDASEALIAEGSLWISLTDRDEVARFPKG